MFRSVRSKVIAIATGIAVLAVVVSSLLAARTTGQALRGEAERSLEVDTSIYRRLFEYAETHPDWSQVDPLVEQLAGSTGRRIALVGGGGEVIADSDRLAGGRPRALPRVPTATIDPQTPMSGVAPRANTSVLDAATLARLNGAARTAGECLAIEGIGFVRIDSATTGPQLVATPPVTDEPTLGAFRSCLAPLVFASNTPTNAAASQGEPPPSASATSTRSLAASAPPVSLYLGSRAENPLTLTGAGLWRVVGVIVAVAAAAALLAWMLGRRITRPLVALTAASRQLGAGLMDTRVPIEHDDEVGELAGAFNSMADSLARTELARRRMVADVAHELRNPLVTINGTLEAIQDGVYEPTPEVIESLIEETDLLRRIITDLQDLAAIDAGTVRIRRQSVDLVDLCTSAAEAYRGGSPDVDLVVVSTQPEMVIDADPDRVRQIIGNLLSNALRHTPGNGTVSVSVDRAVGFAVVVVADTGPGIAADDVARVFDRLWRADSSRARDTGGSGLGLSIAREFARAHGGDITVESAPGAGARFTVRLPLDAPIHR